MSHLVPDAALPTPDEEAVFFCYHCKLRKAYASKGSAKRAQAKHRKQTGHDISTVFVRVHWDKTPVGPLMI